MPGHQRIRRVLASLPQALDQRVARPVPGEYVLPLLQQCYLLFAAQLPVVFQVVRYPQQEVGYGDLSPQRLG